MRRRPPSGAPARLLSFDPADWPAENYSDAAELWRTARDAWADANGWEGDPAWYEEEHRVAMAIPDEPFDWSKI